MTTIGERVAEAINDSGCSVKDIAEACSISVQAVYSWKRGDVKDLRNDNLFALADATGYEARWIGTDRGPKKSTELRAAQNTARYNVSRLSDASIQLAEYIDRLPPEIRAEIIATVVKSLIEISIRNPNISQEELGKIIAFARQT